MPNARKQDRQLDALYDSLPAMRCQGHCSDACGPIAMSVRERARIIERARAPVTCGAHATCSMLTPERRCSVYDIRPMICRLWGLVRSMKCPYGCRPEGGWLPDSEGIRLLAEADRIGESELGSVVMEQMLATLREIGAEELARMAWRGKGFGATIAGRPGALPPEARPIIELPLKPSQADADG
jgi:Fe-S-cluster containining protein